MNKSIWYISKYASIQNHGTATQTRGYYLAKELNELGYKTKLIEWILQTITVYYTKNLSIYD